MEIDITKFVRLEEPYSYSASAAEIGSDAGRITWRNALDEAQRHPLLRTEDQLQALRDHVESMGFGAEVQDYGADECNALFIQLISGDLREMGLDDCDLEDFDWAAYQERAEQGSIASNIFRGDIEGNAGFGRIFYYLGS